MSIVEAVKGAQVRDQIACMTRRAGHGGSSAEHCSTILSFGRQLERPPGHARTWHTSSVQHHCPAQLSPISRPSCAPGLLISAPALQADLATIKSPTQKLARLLQYGRIFAAELLGQVCPTPHDLKFRIAYAHMSHAHMDTHSYVSSTWAGNP